MLILSGRWKVVGRDGTNCTRHGTKLGAMTADKADLSR